MYLGTWKAKYRQVYGGLDSVEWNGGLECWNGMVDWNTGMERWNGMVEFSIRHSQQVSQSESLSQIVRTVH